MTALDLTEFEQLILQIERDLVAQAHLRTLLAVADSTVAGHKRDLRTETARRKSVPLSGRKQKKR